MAHSTGAVDVTGVAGGARLRLRVRPGGRADRVVGAHGGALKLEVTASPERGKANAAVVKLMARSLEVDRRAVQIVAGETSQNKTVVVSGLTAGELAERMSSLGITARVSG